MIAQFLNLLPSQSKVTATYEIKKNYTFGKIFYFYKNIKSLSVNFQFTQALESQRIASETR